MKKLLPYTIVLVVLFFTNSIVAQSLNEQYERVSPSVVQVLVKEEKSAGVGDPYDKVETGGLGTGVLVSETGEIITAAHVVANASQIEIVYKDGTTSSATIQNVSKSGDVALLLANTVSKTAKIAVLGDSDKMSIGDNVFIIGFPMGLEYSLSKGIISGIHKDKSKFGKGLGMEFFQTDAAINTGNSGGPMFNDKGEVVGIISSILSRSGGFEGVGFASTSNLTEDLLFTDEKFWFGIDGHFLQGVLAEVLNLPQEAALMVSSVTPNSPAYFLGLRGGYLKTTIGKDDLLLGGDIILSIEGIKLDSIDNIGKVWKMLEDKKQFDVIDFEVLRSGRIKTYQWKIK